MIRALFRLLLAASLLCAGPALAQSYPAKPVKLVMPYPPGGGGDLVLRPLIEKLMPSFGQTMVIDYKPGANTIIGTDFLAKSAPDGYTLSMITDSHSINPVFRKNMPYDAIADFAPVTQLVGVPLVLVTHPSVPAKTLPELVAYAKANPGKLAYASLGFGAPHYIAMEWFKLLAGVDLLHVPYQGSAPALAALVGGQVQLMFVGASTGLQYAKDGRLNVIAAGSARRLPTAPNLPTVAESYREYDFTTWYGIVAPIKTPPDIVAKLSREIGAALRSHELQERLGNLGLIPAPSTPEEFAAKLRADGEHYARIIKATGARGE